MRFIREKITYKALIEGMIVPNHIIIDEVPFTCLIDRDDIKENDTFTISSLDIICDVLGKKQILPMTKRLEKKLHSGL
ncbi:hypothetical protein ACI2OX_21275 [Bacillus sp. N9]